MEDENIIKIIDLTLNNVTSITGRPFSVNVETQIRNSAFLQVKNFINESVRRKETIGKIDKILATPNRMPTNPTPFLK